MTTAFLGHDLTRPMEEYDLIGDGEPFSPLPVKCNTRQGIRVSAIVFARVARRYDDHPVWEAVEELLARAAQDLQTPYQVKPKKPTHLRLVHSAT
jgi:hypothetical protein